MELTMTELEHYLKPLILDDMILEVKKDEDDIRIDVLDDAPCMIDGQDYGTTTRPIVLLLDENGIIGFIEHSYGAFTVMNKDDVKHLIDLIGAKVTF